MRVVYDTVSVDVDLDGRIHTYSGIAEAAAVKHLGMTLTEAHVPMSALSLRGPVAFTEDLSEVVLASLGRQSTLSLGLVIDRTRVENGAWYLLVIDRPPRGGKML